MLANIRLTISVDNRTTAMHTTQPIGPSNAAIYAFSVVATAAKIADLPNAPLLCNRISKCNFQYARFLVCVCVCAAIRVRGQPLGNMNTKMFDFIFIYTSKIEENGNNPKAIRD